MVTVFKKGQRIIGNEKNPVYSGRTGTVSYVSGTDYWVRFDDNETVEGGIRGWHLDPLTGQDQAEAA